MDNIVYAPLTNIDSCLTTLISSLQTSPTFATAPAATQSLLSADDALTSALNLLETHQRNYAKILRLRAEAADLENNIRGIVRRAGQFRKEIEEITPGILDEDSDDEEQDGPNKRWEEIDYTVLLNFARGIGKFNAEAAKEVQQQEQRFRVEAKKRDATGSVNGTHGERSDITTSEGMKDPTAANQILERAAAWLNQTAEERRVMGSMAFPSGERLRTGVLGRLQATREENGGGERGDEAVEREIEKLIAIAEGREVADQKMEEDQEVSSMGGVEQFRGGGPAPGHASRKHMEVKREEKKALDLDLWNESEEDE